MISKRSKRTESGVITVYLTLILMLVLSLVLTVVEGARVSTAKVFAERALSTAMDSVWAEYYKPLWKEYHIFGYAAGEGNESEKSEGLKEKLARYMSYSLQPDLGLAPGISPESTELYDIRISSLEVTEQTGLIAYQGELMRKEAVEYMKYHELADGLTLLLDKLSLMETPRKVSAVYEKKLAAEQELAKADKNMLRLMELLDGIQTSKTGIKLDHENRLLTTEYFAKMLCIAPVTMEEVGVNHAAVFEAVKDRYINPCQVLAEVNSELGQLQAVTSELERLTMEISALQVSMNSVSSQLQSSQGGKKSKKAEEQLAALSGELAELQEQLSQLYNQERELYERKTQLFSSAEGRLNRLNQTLMEMLPIVEEAKGEAGQVLVNVTAASPLIEAFEESLEQEEGLEEELIKELKEKLAQMKQYSLDSEENNELYGMYQILESNRGLLRAGQEVTQRTLDYLRMQDYSSALTSSGEILGKLQEYEIKGLTIDYSTLVLDSTAHRNPVKELEKLIQSGIAGLIIDPNLVSDKRLAVGPLPSAEAMITQETSDFTSVFNDFFRNSIGGEKNGLGDILNNFQDTTRLSAGIEDGINRITELLLYQEYLREHFEGYPTGEEELAGRKPSVLDYELEYLLIGKPSDGENLASVLSRIVFLRMIMDFITILGDKTRCEEAKLAAAAIVGFTGLPMLITVTQAILLMVWSFAEALVDTCALVLGKTVPIRKLKLELQFNELFILNRSFLRTKAEALTTSKELSLSYKDYLRMFLLIKNKKDLTCRSMDLIQENLNLRYEEERSLRDCLFGYEVSAEYMVATKFTAIPFLRSSIKHKVTGYRFSCSAGYSY